MAVFPRRRHALAAACAMAFAWPAQATEYPAGIVVDGSVAFFLDSGDTVSVSGPATRHALVIAPRGSFDASGIAVINRTAGSASGYAYGVLAFGGSEAFLEGSNVAVFGEKSVGMQAQDAGALVAENVSVNVHGDTSVGIAARSGASVSLARTRVATAAANVTGLLAQGDGSALTGQVSVLHTGSAPAGGGARGYAQAVAVRDGGHVALADSDIVAGQAHVDAVSLEGDASSFTATRARIVAEGAGSAALASRGGRFQLDEGELKGSGYAILTHGTGNVATNVLLRSGTRMAGRMEAGDTPLVFEAEDSAIEGDMYRGGTGRFDAMLRRSAWAGRAEGVNDLRLEQSSWRMTGDSSVQRLTLAEGARVAFDDTTPGFATLRVGTLANTHNTAVVQLRTRLDAGGALRRQGTDRLLVVGDAEGSTSLDIAAAGGAGAATAPGPGGGISVAQVGGAASAGSFRLVGDYVAVGPWRYHLQSYAPGDADPAQRLVDGTGNNFWDFRLQSTHVDEKGRVSRGIPEPSLTSRAALAPQVPAYLVMSNALFGYGRESVDAMRTDDDVGIGRAAIRARFIGGHTSYRSTLPFERFGFDYRRRTSGLQVAGDMLTADALGMDMRTGIVATAGKLRVAPRAVDGGSEIGTTSRALALTHVITLDQGWRFQAAYAATRHQLTVHTRARGDVLRHAGARASDLLLATSFRHGDDGGTFVVEPGVSFLWQRLNVSGVTDGDGIRLRTGESARLTMRAGALASAVLRSAGASRTGFSIYADARYVSTRDRGSSIDLSGTRLPTGHGGGGWELSSGAVLALTRRTAATADVSGRWRHGGAGEAGTTVRLGLTMAL